MNFKEGKAGKRAMEFEQQLQTRVSETEEILKRYIPQETGYQKTVIEAMNYSILAGGKRLRPLLMKEAYHLFGGKGVLVEPFMTALEMIHTYSLVHDDLPCMDNDEYRRGRKTTHVIYGEGMAVLAGDGLLNFAYETAAGAFDLIEEEDFLGYKRVARAMQILTRKAGIYGMIGGQTADVEAEERKTPASGELLLFIHEKKTAALIQSAMMIGAVLAGANEEQVDKMKTCAYNLGIAFQIQDDILDVTGTMEELGKPIGSDAKNHKQTYVTLKGLDESRREVELLSKQAVELVDSCSKEGNGSFLKELILALIHRTK